MASADIVVYRYLGSVASINLLSPNTTLIGAGFSKSTQTLVDGDGTLQSWDNGASTLGGHPISYIGSGSIRFGVEAGGVVLGGVPKDVVLFNAGGEVYFYYPNDDGPTVLTGLASVLNIAHAPAQVFTPVCFTEGTSIRTPHGDVAIETLQAGDMIVDLHGKAHRIRWIGSRTVDLSHYLLHDRARLAPVVIPAGALGPGRPERELRISQQHRVLLDNGMVELLFGLDEALVPARSLVGDIVHIDTRCRKVTYIHILCDRHVIAVSNGLATETLLPWEIARENLDPAAWQEITSIFPELARRDRCMAANPAAPILKRFEAEVIARSVIRS